MMLPRYLAGMIAGWAAVALASGCGHVDASADLEATEGIVRERTGVAGFEAEDRPRDAVDAMLDTLLAGGIDSDEAVAIALMNNAELRARLLDVGIARADVVAAGIPENPVLAASVRLPDGPGLANLSGTILQTITDLLLAPARERVAKTRLDRTRLDVARHAVELAAAVRGDWSEAVARQTTLEVIEDEHRLLERAVALARDRTEAGLADVLDVNLARAAELDIRREELGARHALEASLVTLGRRLGLARRAQPWTVRGSLAHAGGDPRTDELLRRALETRLDVEIARLDARAADEDLERAAGTAVPALAFGVDVERPEAPPAIIGPAVEIELPLFGRSGPEIARARFRAIQERKRLRAVLDRVAAEVRRAAVDVGSARRMIRLYDGELLPAAREGLDAASSAYAAGTRDIVVLVEAQRTLVRRRRDHVQALLELARARADLERAVGGPLAPPGGGDSAP